VIGRNRDPLADPAPLVRRVYAYVAYRIGDGADAEDVTSEVFERALRYRESYDPSRGRPLPWLLGIARRCLDDALRRRPPAAMPGEFEAAVPHDVSGDVVRRIELAAALEKLDGRARELLALRFGADLTARQIGEVLGMRTNAVEVSLHRTLAALRRELDDRPDEVRSPPRGAADATPR
jgi:RNA polymerase sigma-70 factor (ECF subfamily)